MRSATVGFGRAVSLPLVLLLRLLKLVVSLNYILY
jgi:hypothetical protein